jgi:pyruvate/2-oxoglutarate dehydrogenase complex dihydrolipoamide dehydrogenase (E3) component
MSDKNAKSCDFIVLGGGSGGLVAAVGAAKLGARVALIEKTALGGDCLWTGCVPSKALIRSARFAHEMRQAGTFGFAPVTPNFDGGSFAAITRRVRRVIETVGLHDDPEVFRRQGVDVIFGAPRFVNAREITVKLNDTGEEKSFTAKRFCLSTGSRPAVPPVEGLRETGFITNEEIFHLTELPGSLIVLGAGAIGVELGQAMARLGAQVTLVEMAGRVLPREDEEVSATVENFLRDEGLEILLNAKAARVRRTEDGRKAVSVGTGEITADEILVATGRRANVEGLNLEAAGVEYDPTAVKTDAYLRTTARHIFAAGDVTGHFQFTHLAAYEASVAVRNAFLFWPWRQKTDWRVVPWAVFTDPETARVGLTETEARERFGDVKIYRMEVKENDRALTEDETRGFVKLICAGRKEQIVGGHLVAPRAGDLIHEIAFAMRQRMSAAALGGLIHVYPTFTQVTQQAGVEAVLAQFEKPLTKSFLSKYLNLWRRFSH